MSDPSFRPRGERVVHEGKIWRVAVATFEAPDGSTFDRDVVRSPGAVGVVPLLFDCEGNPSVVLVRQYRPILDDWLVEIPAGMRDVAGEPPAETGNRELQEEAGFAADHLVELIQFVNSAGMTDAATHVFLATGLRPVAAQAHGPEEDHLQVLQVPLATAVAMVERSEITDAKTVIGLLLAERRLAAADDGDVHGSADVPGTTSGVDEPEVISGSG